MRSIRPATAADLPAFYAYLNQHLQDNGRDGTPLFQPMPRGRSQFPAEKAACFTQGLNMAVGMPGWCRAWIACDAHGIQGHIDLRARPEAGTAHRALLGMGVQRGARRQGLGRQLVDTALAWASQQDGLAWVDLEVLSANLPALRLYQACGWDQTGATADLFRIDGERLSYTYMTRRLGLGL